MLLCKLGLELSGFEVMGGGLHHIQLFVRAVLDCILTLIILIIGAEQINLLGRRLT